MDRTGYHKEIPFCPNRRALVDQYMHEKKNNPHNDGCISWREDEIFSCDGTVKLSVPLENYPPVTRMFHERRENFY